MPIRASRKASSKLLRVTLPVFKWSNAAYIERTSPLEDKARSLRRILSCSSLIGTTLPICFASTCVSFDSCRSVAFAVAFAARVNALVLS